MLAVNLGLTVKHVNRIICKSMSTATQKNYESKFQSSKPFHIFTLPAEITPAFELTRSFANLMNKLTYYYTEREYSDKKFLNGAKSAIVQMAKVIREKDIESMNDIALKQLTTELREKMDEIPQDVLKKRLSFNKDNIVHAFIHHLLIAPEKAFNIDPQGLSVYGKVIAVIQPNSTQEVSLNKALRNANDETLFCNVTVCRHLNPPDIWKVSHINFFEKRWVY